jgi:hypothetical protein
VLLSICAAFYDPAIPAVIPQIVKKDQLVKANSLTQFVQGFSTIAGPMLGGIAVATIVYPVAVRPGPAAEAARPGPGRRLPPGTAAVVRGGGINHFLEYCFYISPNFIPVGCFGRFLTSTSN